MKVATIELHGRIDVEVLTDEPEWARRVVDVRLRAVMEPVERDENRARTRRAEDRDIIVGMNDPSTVFGPRTPFVARSSGRDLDGLPANDDGTRRVPRAPLVTVDRSTPEIVQALEIARGWYRMREPLSRGPNVIVVHGALLKPQIRDCVEDARRLVVAIAGGGEETVLVLHLEPVREVLDVDDLVSVARVEKRFGDAAVVPSGSAGGRRCEGGVARVGGGFERGDRPVHVALGDAKLWHSRHRRVRHRHRERDRAAREVRVVVNAQRKDRLVSLRHKREQRLESDRSVVGSPLLEPGESVDEAGSKRASRFGVSRDEDGVVAVREGDAVARTCQCLEDGSALEEEVGPALDARAADHDGGRGRPVAPFVPVE